MSALNRRGFIYSRIAIAILICLVTALIPAAVLADASSSATAAAGWFHSSRIAELVGIVIAVLVLAIAALLVKRGKRLQLRSLPALDAVGDALGRATELGTPVLYSTGWGGDMGRPTTMASMGILAEIAKRAAEYNCRLLFPSHDPLIVSVAQETVSQSALAAGRPDWYRADDISFVSQSQLGYAAAVDGMMAREHPGAVFLRGSFEGGALILAETAHQTGALTIAGTDSTIELSFFLVACDYTLIGEELFAASGIVAKDPAAAAAVWSQDWLKYLVLTLLIVGAALTATVGFNLFQWTAK
ncbi:MAG: hypothetical protein HZB43_12065 [candidate division Zixibacteria bacterium]|nr:hypothetical protein [candidate division Zixibacteria bacterium]